MSGIFRHIPGIYQPVSHTRYMSRICLLYSFQVISSLCLEYSTARRRAHSHARIARAGHAPLPLFFISLFEALTPLPTSLGGRGRGGAGRDRLVRPRLPPPPLAIARGVRAWGGSLLGRRGPNARGRGRGRTHRLLKSFVKISSLLQLKITGPINVFR